MERKLFLTLLSLFFAIATFAQVIIPENTQINSDLEKITLRQVRAGEHIDPFMLQLSVNYVQEQATDEMISGYRELVTYLGEKRAKGMSDADFLRFLYYRVHKKMLRNYTTYTSFSGLMQSGNYDCLSATILYALLLDEFGFSFRIVDTDYHIYLLTETDDQLVMMESTDPINGFVIDEVVIAERMNEINSRNEMLAEQYLTFQESERQFSDFRKLAALQYFNAAVDEYNNARLISAVDQLEKARFYDDASRFEVFGKFLAREIAADESLDDQTRSGYLFKLTRFLNSGMITASL